jgi:hypothetical protein
MRAIRVGRDESLCASTRLAGATECDERFDTQRFALLHENPLREAIRGAIEELQGRRRISSTQC